MDIPAPWEGVVEQLHAAEGDVVKVGKPPRLDPSVEAESPTSRPRPRAKPRRQAVLVGYGVAEETRPLALRRHPAARLAMRTAPPRALEDDASRVRKLAKELGVDLAVVRGSGPDGRVTRADVEAAAGSSPRPARARPLHRDGGHLGFTAGTSASP